MMNSMSPEPEIIFLKRVIPAVKSPCPAGAFQSRTSFTHRKKSSYPSRNPYSSYLRDPYSPRSGMSPVSRDLFERRATMYPSASDYLYSRRSPTSSMDLGRKRESEQDYSYGDKSSDDEHPTKKPKLQSAVVAKREDKKTRKMAIEEQDGNSKVKLRNRRMFQSIVDTLQKCKNEEVECQKQDTGPRTGAPRVTGPPK